MKKQAAVVESYENMLRSVGKEVSFIAFRTDEDSDNYCYLYFNDGTSVGTHAKTPESGNVIAIPLYTREGKKLYMEYIISPYKRENVLVFLIDNLVESARNLGRDDEYAESALNDIMKMIHDFLEIGMVEKEARAMANEV